MISKNIHDNNLVCVFRRIFSFIIFYFFIQTSWILMNLILKTYISGDNCCSYVKSYHILVGYSWTRWPIIIKLKLCYLIWVGPLKEVWKNVHRVERTMVQGLWCARLVTCYWNQTIKEFRRLKCAVSLHPLHQE